MVLKLGSASDKRRAREASARRVRKRLGTPGEKRASEATIRKVTTSEARDGGGGGGKRTTTVVIGEAQNVPGAPKLGTTVTTETLASGQTVQVTSEPGVTQEQIERQVTQLRADAGRSYRQVLNQSAYEQQQQEIQSQSLQSELSKQYFKQTPFGKTPYDTIQEKTSPYVTVEKTKSQQFYEEKIKPRIKQARDIFPSSFRPFESTRRADQAIAEGKEGTSRLKALGFVSKKIIEPGAIKVYEKFQLSPFTTTGAQWQKAKVVESVIEGKQQPSPYITALAIDEPYSIRYIEETAKQKATAGVQYFTRAPLRTIAIGAVETGIILGFKGLGSKITRTPASFGKSAFITTGTAVGVAGAVGLGGAYFKDVAERMEGKTFREQEIIKAEVGSELVGLGFVPARSKQLARTVEELGITQRRGRKPASSVERQIQKQQSEIYEEASEFGKLELRGVSDTRRIDVEQSLPVRSPTDRAIARQFQKFAEEKDLSFFGSITSGAGADVEVALQKQTTLGRRIKRTLGIETPTTLAFEFSEQLTKISPKLQPEITQFPTGQVDLSIGEFKGTFTQPRYLETTASAYVGGYNVLRTTPGVGELTLPLGQRIPRQSQRLLSQQYLSKYQGVLRGRAKDLPGLFQTRGIITRELAGAGLSKSKIYKERYERLVSKPPVFELPQAKTATEQFGEAIVEATPLEKAIEKRQRAKYNPVLARAEQGLIKAESFVKELPTTIKEGIKKINPLSKLDTTITYEPVAERAKFLESKGEMQTIRPYLTKEKVGTLLPFVSLGVPIETATDRPTLTSARIKQIAVRPQPRPTPKRPYAPLKRTLNPLYGASMAGVKTIATPSYGPSTKRKGYGAPAGGYTLPSPSYPVPSGSYKPLSRYTPPKGGYTPAKPYRVTKGGYVPITGYALTRGGYTPTDYTKTPGIGGFAFLKPGKMKVAPFQFMTRKQKRRYAPTLRATVGGIKSRRKGAKTKRLTGLEERPLLF